MKNNKWENYEEEMRMYEHKMNCVGKTVLKVALIIGTIGILIYLFGWLIYFLALPTWGVIY